MVYSHISSWQFLVCIQINRPSACHQKLKKSDLCQLFWLTPLSLLTFYTVALNKISRKKMFPEICQCCQNTMATQKVEMQPEGRSLAGRYQPFVSSQYLGSVYFEMLKLKIFGWDLFELTLENGPKIQGNRTFKNILCHHHHFSPQNLFLA